MLFGPLMIFSGCLIALRRHKKTMFESASQCVNSHNHLYAALEEQAAKPRIDSESTPVRKSTFVASSPLRRIESFRHYFLDTRRETALSFHLVHF